MGEGQQRYVGVRSGGPDSRCGTGWRARRGPATPEEVAGSLVALHGTDPATVCLAVGARLTDPTVTETERALYVMVEGAERGGRRTSSRSSGCGAGRRARDPAGKAAGQGAGRRTQNPERETSGAGSRARGGERKSPKR